MAILAALVVADILHIDEASYRLNGKTVWAWMLLNPKTGETFFVMCPDRGANVLDLILSKF